MELVNAFLRHVIQFITQFWWLIDDCDDCFYIYIAVLHSQANSLCLHASLVLAGNAAEFAK